MTAGSAGPEDTAAPDREVADMAGPSALPRKNGELVFEAAWEGRAFGLATAMHGDQRFAWDEFRDRLIEEIAEADRRGGESAYYERWLDAFERLLVDKEFMSREEIASRLAEFESGQRDDVF
jgi:nitrile hydratase accessory protein